MEYILSDLHNQAFVNEGVSINRYFLAIRPALSLNLGGPEDQYDRHQEHILGQVSPWTDATAKSESDVALVLGTRQRRPELAYFSI